MGVMKKHQRVVKKKSSRTKAQRKHRRQENQELAQQVTRANPRRDRAQSRTRQPPAAAQVPGQAAGSLHPLHLLLGPAPRRPRHRRRKSPLGAGRAVSWPLLRWPRSSKDSTAGRKVRLEY